jgi:hypothetical protein
MAPAILVEYGRGDLLSAEARKVNQNITVSIRLEAKRQA